MRRRGLLLIVSGPAGSGKTTLAEKLIAAEPDIVRSVTATTRAPRDGEVDGTDYHFLSRVEFESRLAAGHFIEYTEFNHNLYGSLREEVERLLDADKVVVLVIEVEGAANVRALYPHSVHVFVLPPTPADLRDRLAGRGTESEESMRHRLSIAEGEVEELERYDYLVINDELDAAAEDLRTIARVARAHHVRGGEVDAWRGDRYAGWHPSSA